MCRVRLGEKSDATLDDIESFLNSDAGRADTDQHNPIRIRGAMDL
jgi:hypothetical protein